MLGQMGQDSTVIIVVIGGNKGGKNGVEYEEVIVWDYIGDGWC